MIQALQDRRRGIVYAATGAGKSELLALVLASFRPVQGLTDVIGVPTQNLVTQTVRGLAPWGIDAAPWFQGHYDLGGRSVVIACRQSMETLVDRLVMEGRQVRAVVVDEAHGLGSESKCLAAIQRMKAECCRSARGMPMVGVTATPHREQGDMSGLWPAGLLYSYPIQQAIADGVIMRPRVIMPTSDVDLEGDADEVTIDHIQRFAHGPTVVDAPTIPQAKAFAKLLTERGIPAAAVWGTQKAADTDRALADLRSGRIRVVVHVKLLSEGVDMPWLETMVIRVETGSINQWVQRVGRVVRTAPGKTSCTLIDLRDQWRKFGLPEFVQLDDPDLVDEEKQARPPLPRTPGKLAKAKAQDPIRFVREVEAWLVALVAGLEAAGLVESRIRNNRYPDPSARMADTLRGWAAHRRSSPARHLPENERERWHALCESAATLSGQGAADAIRVGIALNKAGGEWYRAQGTTWAGARHLTFEG